jgi:ABC-type nitrate/sulfonate/bicarbonate transport system ATPase subunit
VEKKKGRRSSVGTGRPKLSVENMTRRFGETLALATTDLRIRSGEFVSIVGPSGCGKSTLFNVIAGILPPSAGRVLIDGVEVTGSTGHVGYMLQKDLLLPWRTVSDNIVLGAILKGGATRKQRAEGVALAQRYGLGDFVNHYPSALSGGMRQRVALMRTLAMHHDLMLLDEPFGALDSQTRLAMQQWLLSVWQEQQRTVLFVTHDIDEAILLADRVVVMTPRPGSIRDIFEVGIERPRPLSCLTSQAFMALKRHTLGLIYADGVTSPETVHVS